MEHETKLIDMAGREIDALMHMMREAYKAAGYCIPDEFIPETRLRNLLRIMTSDLAPRMIGPTYSLDHLRRSNKTVNDLILLNPTVLIWSNEHNLYWREGGAGYTSLIAHAGAYPFTEAWERTNHCGREKGILYVTVPQ